MYETPPSTERPLAVLGEAIGDYRVERAVGDGTSGQVVEGRGPSGDRVAIKIAHTTHPETAARFRRSARAMMALESAHIVRVLEVAETHDGRPAMVMEWLEGRHLGAELAAEGVLPIDDVVRWMIEVCSALEEAHATRVFHRDLKPENIFLVDGSARVLDFGFAPPFPHLGLAEKKTRPGSLAGTSPYLAPEQIQKGEVDARTDVWAVGACLFRLLTNRHPFSGATVGDVTANILSEEPADVGALRPDVSEELEAVIARCLKKTPRHRYDTARALENALRGAHGTVVDRHTPVVDLAGHVSEDLRSTPHVTRAAMPLDEATDPGGHLTPLAFEAAPPEAATVVGDAPTATDNRAPLHVTPVRPKSRLPRKTSGDALPPISFHLPSSRPMPSRPMAHAPRRPEIAPADDPPTEVEHVGEIADLLAPDSDPVTTVRTTRDDFPSAPFTPLSLPTNAEPIVPQPMPVAPRAPSMTPPQPLAIAPVPGGPALPMLMATPAPLLGPPTPQSFPPAAIPAPYPSQPPPLAALSSASVPVAAMSSASVPVVPSHRRGAASTTVKKQASNRGPLVAFTLAFVIALGGGAVYAFRYSPLAESLGTKPEPPRPAPTTIATPKAKPVEPPPAETTPPPAPEPTTPPDPEPEPGPTAPASTALPTPTHVRRPAAPRPAGDDILNKRK